ESVTAHRYPMSPRLLTSQIKSIVFDLDDTLADTFGLLIVPLEVEAAKAIVAAGACENDSITIASNLLRLRRHSPGDLENELKRSGYTKRALAARNKLLTSVPIDNFMLSPEVIQLLRQLRNHFELCLLTAGQHAFQTRKIKKLEIKRHFAEIMVVS